MTSSYEDTVLNFDLDLLHQQTPECTDELKTEKDQKAQKTISFLKQNAITNDSLMRQCLQIKEILHNKEKALFVTKQGYQEACIQYKNALDQCSKLENDIKFCQIQNQEIKQKHENLENQYEALQSHTKQLEAFVKELEIEKELNKSKQQLDKTNSKNSMKGSRAVLKENKILIQDLYAIGRILKKGKLKVKHKKLLQKYEKYFKKGDNNEIDLNIEDDTVDDNLMSLSSIDDISNHNVKVQSITIADPGVIPDALHKTRKKSDSHDDIDEFSDCSNEITSADTGRGSSLAFSDNEKFLHSPEYFPHVKNAIKSRVHVGTNTEKQLKSRDVATSPIHHKVQSIPTVVVEKAKAEMSNVATSPIDFGTGDISKKRTNHIDIDTNDNGCKVQPGSHLEKECLQVNSSNILDDDCSRDCEIEKILSIMQFNNKLITPIPNSPSESIHLDTEVSRISVACQTSFKCRCETIQLFHKKLIKSISSFTNNIEENNKGVDQQSKSSEHMDIEVNSTCTQLFVNPLSTKRLSLSKSRKKEIRNIPVNRCDVALGTEPPSDSRFLPQNSDRTSPALIEVPEVESIALAEKPDLEENPTARSKLLFEAPVDKNADLEDNLNDNDQIQLTCDQNDDVRHESVVAEKGCKRKLSKLDKLRVKMAPKFKIKEERKLPLAKSCKLRQFMQAVVDQHPVSSNVSSASLNNRAVYENAVKVMSEINRKPSNKPTVVKNKSKDKKNKSVKKENHILEHKSNQESGTKDQIQNLDCTSSNPITTRSRSKCVEQPKNIQSELSPEAESKTEKNKNIPQPKAQLCNILKPREVRKQLKRALANEQYEIQSKRVLRSSTRLSLNDNNLIINNTNIQIKEESHASDDTAKNSTSNKKQELDGQFVIKNDTEQKNSITSYHDLNMFTDESISTKTEEVSDLKSPARTAIQKECKQIPNDHPKHSILCAMIEKYHQKRKPPKKIQQTAIDKICKIIDDGLQEIIGYPPEEIKNAMSNFVDKLENLNVNEFLLGLMKYLQNPQRKIELFTKVTSSHAPAMTKSEKILLYVVNRLQVLWSIDIVHYILKHMQHVLFKINRTPDFDIIESMAHFYAVICRYFDMKTHLRVFVLDAMYTMQYKAIAIVHQVLDVWMHVLPLGHIGLAKNTLVLCVVYLLHFYKCEDHFNRVQDMRHILYSKFSYKMTEWNETRILEMFRNAIKEIKGSADKKIVRIALLVLAKRQGPKWCQKHIITNMLLPMIAKENDNIKHFCISILGPLMKPYPVDMKVHCEIVINQLLDMSKQKNSQHMMEAIFISLMYISKHNQNRVIRELLFWHPKKKISLECEKALCNFVREKPPHIWERVLSKISLNV